MELFDKVTYSSIQKVIDLRHLQSRFPCWAVICWAMLKAETSHLQSECLTLCCLIDPPIPNKWKSQFPVLGVCGTLF